MDTTVESAVEQKFLGLLRPYLKFLGADEPVDPARELEDMGLDSLAAVELLFDIEDNYGVVIPDRLLVPETFRSAQSLWGVVQSLR